MVSHISGREGDQTGYRDADVNGKWVSGTGCVAERYCTDQGEQYYYSSTTVRRLDEWRWRHVA
jgi:hypothetical protein